MKIPCLLDAYSKIPVSRKRSRRIFLHNSDKGTAKNCFGGENATKFLKIEFLEVTTIQFETEISGKARAGTTRLV